MKPVAEEGIDIPPVCYTLEHDYMPFSLEQVPPYRYYPQILANIPKELLETKVSKLIYIVN